MSTPPPISVIVPVFNGERYLKAAIDSILDQSYQSLEIIVVNDGSTDGTEGVCRSLGAAVTYVAQPNRGAASARNAGIECSHGDVIAFLDADDTWTPASLELRLARLDGEPKMVLGMVENFFSDDLSPSERALRAVPLGAQRGFNPSAMLTTRGVFEKVGMFDADIGVGEFVDWYVRARDAGVTEDLIPEVVAWRRIHESNTGVLNRDRIGYLTAARRSVERKRGRQTFERADHDD